jgi:hypothetical protein
VSRLRDVIDQIERKLDKGDLDPLNRRLMLRDFLGALQRESFEEGRTEGMCDAHDAENAEKRLAAAREESDGG